MRTLSKRFDFVRDSLKLNKPQSALCQLEFSGSQTNFKFEFCSSVQRGSNQEHDMNLNPNIVFRKEFDGTGLFYNPDNGQTFYLNKTSRIICECLEKGLDKEGIISSFKEKVDGVPEDIGKVIEDFIEQLRTRGIVEDNG